MALDLINIGNIANDGTGDDLREAFIKVNQNFEELDLRSDELTTASNIGTQGAGVFAQRVNYDLQFKRLVQGDNVSIVEDNEKITINALQHGIEDIVVFGDTGSSTLEGSAVFTISGGNGISTSISGTTLTITSTGIVRLVDDTTPELGGDLDAQGYSIHNVGNINALTVSANLTGLVNGVDPAEYAKYFIDFDFGEIGQNVTNIVEWLTFAADVDFGTFTQPEFRTIDFGSF